MSMSRLEAVLATIDAQADAAQTRLDQAESFAQRSQALSVSGTSSDEVATVTVDGTGQVTDVRLSDDFARFGSAEVAADVMEALRQAQRRLSFHVEQLGVEIYGPGSPSVDAFTQAYRDKFGYEEDDQR
jgi:DNA-binding protein YbaB